jgi:hypothetical protein
MWRSLAIVALSSACTGPTPNATLADLPGRSVSAQIWESTDDKPTPGFATVGYDTEAFRNAHGGECAVIDLDASFGAAHVDTIWHGGDDDFDGCSDPGFELTFPGVGEHDATLRIEDDSLTIEATFSAEQLAPHAPELRSPSMWRFGAGDAVVLGWSHPQDLIDGATFLADPVYFHTGTLTDPNYFPITAVLSGDEIRFTLPHPAPITGKGYIVTRFGYVNSAAITCTGATTCSLSREAGFSHTVTIDP